jgi:hypothetical protein
MICVLLLRMGSTAERLAGLQAALSASSEAIRRARTPEVHISSKTQMQNRDTAFEVLTAVTVTPWGQCTSLKY